MEEEWVVELILIKYLACSLEGEVVRLEEGDLISRIWEVWEAATVTEEDFPEVSRLEWVDFFVFLN